jgi:hypothetical protein
LRAWAAKRTKPSRGGGETSPAMTVVSGCYYTNRTND